MDAAGPQGIAQLVQVHDVAAKQLVDEQARLAAAAMVPQHQRVLLRRIVLRAPAHEIRKRFRVRHALKRQGLLQEVALRQVVVQIALEPPPLQRGRGDLHAEVLGMPLLAAAGFDQHVHAPGSGRLVALRGRSQGPHDVLGLAAGILAVGNLLQVLRGVSVLRFQVGAAHVEHDRPLGFAAVRLRQRPGDQQHHRRQQRGQK